MFVTAALYADLYIHRAKKAATKTKDTIIENKSELTHIGAAVAVTGIAAHVVGFKSGYAFANTDTPITN